MLKAVVVDDGHAPVPLSDGGDGQDGRGHAAVLDAEATRDSSPPTGKGLCRMAKAFAATAARSRSSTA